MSEIRTAHLMTLALEVEEPQVISGTPTGTRRIVYVSGGSFEGARLSGMVLPGGGDWILERADGSFLLDVRITLLTEDREMIYMTYRGRLCLESGGNWFWRLSERVEFCGDQAARSRVSSAIS